MANESVVNNYATLNTAIETEVEKHRAHARLRHSRTFLNFCIGISLIGALLTLTAYLYYTAQPERPDIGVLSESSEELRRRTMDLASLTARAEGTGVTNAGDTLPPEKEYSSFVSVYADSGERIVTGKKFDAGKWDRPKQQWCYVKTSTSAASGIPLARIRSNGEIEVVTKNETLRRYAADYCRFE